MNFFSRQLWERAHLDLWAIPHFLTGFVSAFAIFVFEWPFTVPFFIFVGVSIGWEIGERIFNIDEAISNSIIDVFVNSAGFIAAYYIVPEIAHTRTGVWQFFAVSAVLLVLWSFFGWVSYAKYARRRHI